MVPIDGTWDDELGEPHILAGAVDRLAVRHYCYASTKREFWVGWRGADGFGEERGSLLYERFVGAGRRGTWINLRSAARVRAG